MYGALGKNKKGEDEEWQIDHVVEIQMFTQYLGISVFDGTDVSAGFMYDLYIVRTYPCSISLPVIQAGHASWCASM